MPPEKRDLIGWSSRLVGITDPSCLTAHLEESKDRTALDCDTEIARTIQKHIHEITRTISSLIQNDADRTLLRQLLSGDNTPLATFLDYLHSMQPEWAQLVNTEFFWSKIGAEILPEREGMKRARIIDIVLQMADTLDSDDANPITSVSDFRRVWEYSCLHKHGVMYCDAIRSAKMISDGVRNAIAELRVIQEMTSS